MNLRVWITRTQPGAGRLGASLQRHGLEVLVAPVLEIEPIAATAPHRNFDVVVFLSEHAVVLGAGKIRMENSVVLAVGERTGAALAELGVEATVPVLHSSAGLLELEELTEVANRRILLVAGIAGLDLLAEELTSRGAQIEGLSVYRRVAVDELSAEQCGELSDVEIIAVSSGDGFQNAARLWFAANGNADVPVLVPSERVALKGKTLGLANVHDCAGADFDAVFRGLTDVGAGQN